MVNEGMDIEIYSRAIYPSDWTASANCYKWTSDNKTLGLMGPTLINFFQTEGYLMPTTPLQVKYRKNRDAFYMVTLEENKAVVGRVQLQHRKDVPVYPLHQCVPSDASSQIADRRHSCCVLVRGWWT